MRCKCSVPDFITILLLEFYKTEFYIKIGQFKNNVVLQL